MRSGTALMLLVSSSKLPHAPKIYIAKVANRETLGRDSYDAIAKAVNHAVTEWNVDIISMSF